MSSPYVPPTGMPRLGALVENYVNVENHTGDAAALARIAALEAIGDGRPAYVVGYHAAYTNVLEAAVEEALQNIGPSLGPFVFNGNLNLDNGVGGISANIISFSGNKYIVPSSPDQEHYSVSTQCADWPAGDPALDVGKYYIVKIPADTVGTYSIRLNDIDGYPVNVEHNDSVAITLGQDGVTKTFQKIDNAVTNIEGTTYTSVTRAAGTNNFTVDLSASSKTSLGLADASIQSVAAAAGNNSITVASAGSVKNITVQIADGYTSAINDTLTEIMTRLQTVTTFMGFMESTGQFFDNNGNPVTFSSNMAITSEPFDSTSLLSLGSNGIVGFPADANDLHVASGSPGSATLTSSGTGFQRTITLDYIPLASPPNALDKSLYFWRILDFSRAVVPFGQSASGNTVWSNNPATYGSYAGADGYAFYNSSGVEQPNLVLQLTFTTPGSYFIELFRLVTSALPRGIPVGGTPTAVVFIQSLSIEAPAPANTLEYETGGTLFSDYTGNLTFSGQLTYDGAPFPTGSSGVLTLGNKSYDSVTITSDNLFGNFEVLNIGTSEQLMPTGYTEDGSFQVTFLATINGAPVQYTATTNLPKIVDLATTNIELVNTTNAFPSMTTEPAFIGDVLDLNFVGPATNAYNRIDYALYDGVFESGTLNFVTGTSYEANQNNTVTIINPYSAATGPNNINIYLQLAHSSNSPVPHIIGDGVSGPKIFAQFTPAIANDIVINDLSDIPNGAQATYDAETNSINYGNSFNLLYNSSPAITVTGNWPKEIGVYNGTIYVPITTYAVIIDSGTAVDPEETAVTAISSPSGGAGENMSLSITRTPGSTDYSIQVLNFGTGYAIGNTLTVLGSVLGGADGTNDLTLIITSIASAYFNNALGSPDIVARNLSPGANPVTYTLYVSSDDGTNRLLPTSTSLQATVPEAA